MTTNPTPPTLLDYSPSQAEEVARLTRKAQEQNARIEAILADPAIKELGTNAQRIRKLLKDYSGATEAYDKLTKSIRKLTRIEIVEPAENGFYILTTSEMWRDEVKIEKTFVLKAFGSWFNLEEGGNTLNLGMKYGRAESFTEFFNIGEDTIEATLTRVPDQSVFPAQLLADEVEATGEGEK